jgi:hypothetical protein
MGVNSIHPEIYDHLTVHFPRMRYSRSHEHQAGIWMPLHGSLAGVIRFVERVSCFEQISEGVLQELKYFGLRL